MPAGRKIHGTFAGSLNATVQPRAHRGTVALSDPAGHEKAGMTFSSATGFTGFRFPREVISVAVRWYLRYGLSYRDVDELLAERGVDVDHVTVYRWVARFTPKFVETARTRRHVPGDRWFVDEIYVKVNGRWTYLYRAVDQYGQVIDVWLSVRRDLAARCVVSRRSDRHTASPPVMPSCRTSDAATMRPPSTRQPTVESWRRSTHWRSPSDRHQMGVGPTPDRTTQQSHAADAALANPCPRRPELVARTVPKGRGPRVWSARATVR